MGRSGGMGYRSIRTFHERGEEERERNLDFGNESSCIAGLNWDECFMDRWNYSLRQSYQLEQTRHL